MMKLTPRSLPYVAGVSEEEFTTVQTFLTKFEALIDRHQ